MSLSRVLTNRRAAARRRMESARTNHALNKAIAAAGTPGMRDELVLAAQRFRDYR